MSFKYDRYIEHHRKNVKQGYDWLSEYLPEVLENTSNIEWLINFGHDQSKNEPDEYEAYDAYFYGNNRSYEVVENFNRAWLLHIHRNPHHWQHWVLINDDPELGETVLEMPYDYIIEMICDWWSFSWNSENLNEIFEWYAEHSEYIKLGVNTRKIVEDILYKIMNKLENIGFDDELKHHGIKGQKWGVKNGPPYPIKEERNIETIRKRSTIVEKAINSGEVLKVINKDKQVRHNKTQHKHGRSYLNGDMEYAQKLVDKYSGTGEAKLDHKGDWNHRERIFADEDIGIYVNEQGEEIPSNVGMIIYSNTGTHIYPVRRKENK